MAFFKNLLHPSGWKWLKKIRSRRSEPPSSDSVGRASRPGVYVGWLKLAKNKRDAIYNVRFVPLEKLIGQEFFHIGRGPQNHFNVLIDSSPVLVDSVSKEQWSLIAGQNSVLLRDRKSRNGTLHSRHGQSQPRELVDFVLEQGDIASAGNGALHLVFDAEGKLGRLADPSFFNKYLHGNTR